MKNITNKTKTILFASLIAAMILPFSGTDFADAENADEKTKRDVLTKTSKIIKTKSPDTIHGNYAYKDFVPENMTNHAFFDIDLIETRDINKNHKAIPIMINGETLVAKLVPDRLLADETAEIDTFKGKIIGKSDSDVRMLINEYQIGGTVQMDGNYYLQALRLLDKRAPDSAYVIYKSQYENGESQLNTRSLIPEASAYTTKTVNLITDCDTEYEALYAANQWDDEQRKVINNIRSLYDDIDITINLVSQDSCSDDAYTNADLQVMVDTDMESYWSTTTGFDMVHLFSGKDLNLGGNDWYKGKADEIGGLDNPQTEGYSASQHAAEWDILYSATDEDKQKLLAHELGHTFGATHGDQGISHWWGTENTIMYWSTTWLGSIQWSPANEATVRSNADAYL